MSSNATDRGTITSMADLTTSGLIVPALCGRDAAAVIRELSQLLQSEAWVPDLLPFFQEAINREFFASSATEYGFAFPHARVNGLHCLRYALGRSVAPLPWVPTGGLAVRLVLLFAVPATDASAYTLAISCLARLGKEGSLVQDLLQSRSADEIVQVLERVKLRRATPPTLIEV